MILIVFKYLTPRGFRGLTFFPFVFMADKKDKHNKVFLNHEKIHIRQQLELLILPFYIWYLLEFFILWIKFKDKEIAYRSIIFEKEAYAKETDFSYLKNRKLWSFWIYYKSK
jgi:hypothetical protein